jgi:hypothetical protein
MRLHHFLCLSVLALWAILLPSNSSAEFYEWKDAEGASHFTDNLESVPQQYRKKLIKREMTNETPRPEPAATRSEPAPVEPAAASGTSGKGEDYWRTRFLNLRNELDGLKRVLPLKRDEMNQKRRQWVVSQKRSDRMALNEIENEVAADETRITELEKQLEQLDVEAAQSAVPLEWRK